MRRLLAFVYADWQFAASYRVNLVFSLLSFLFIIVPVYFVAHALQPTMEPSIEGEGGQYFGFVVVGMATFNFLLIAVNALPQAVLGSIATGTLEALLSTPARLPSLLAGLVSYQFLWTIIRVLALLAAGVLLGAHFSWGRAPAAFTIFTLIILAHLPFGIIAASLVLAFRTTGPLPRFVATLSGLLGGVYYPTKVIPSWIQDLSQAIPLTYGLRALRQTLLEGMPIEAVMRDVGILLVFAIVLLLGSLYTFSHALRYAKRTGTLAQY